MNAKRHAVFDIFKQRRFPVDESLCFVLMPFEKRLNGIYGEIIKPTVEELDMRCLRADEIHAAQAIIDDIWENINRARIIIADLTHRNPNGFYEVGLSHALRKPVVLISQSLGVMPFDLRHLRVIRYNVTFGGRTIFQDASRDTIEFLRDR